MGEDPLMAISDRERSEGHAGIPQCSMPALCLEFYDNQ